VRVLVTRPRPDGERTAARLAERGHDARLAPVLTVAETGAPRPPGLFDAVLLTSANAVPFLRQDDLASAIFAVGERTAAAAREAGAPDVAVARGDGAALARFVAAHRVPPARLLHPTGEARKAEPERSLAAAGYEVAAWPVYAARAARTLDPETAAALAEGSLDAVVHYSRRSADILLRLCDAAGLGEHLRRLPQICLSEDVAEPFRAAGTPCVLTAARPDEASLLERLDAAASPSPSYR
jgi:uroporphyrinogen-III synthase